MDGPLLHPIRLHNQKGLISQIGNRPVHHMPINRKGHKTSHFAGPIFLPGRNFRVNPRVKCYNTVLITCFASVKELFKRNIRILLKTLIPAIKPLSGYLFFIPFTHLLEYFCMDLHKFSSTHFSVFSYDMSGHIANQSDAFFIKRISHFFNQVPFCCHTWMVFFPTGNWSRTICLRMPNGENYITSPCFRDHLCKLIHIEFIYGFIIWKP
jgi:hypothetical protein